MASDMTATFIVALANCYFLEAVLTKGRLLVPYTGLLGLARPELFIYTFKSLMRMNGCLYLFVGVRRLITLRGGSRIGSFYDAVMVGTYLSLLKFTLVIPS